MHRSLSSILLPGLLALTACAESPSVVALPMTEPAPTQVALDGHLSGGELADARDVLDSIEEAPGAERRPDLVAVAREGFSCWENSALDDAPLTVEAAACRTDFWGAVHALSPARSVATAR